MHNAVAPIPFMGLRPRREDDHHGDNDEEDYDRNETTHNNNTANENVPDDDEPLIAPPADERGPALRLVPVEERWVVQPQPQEQPQQQQQQQQQVHRNHLPYPHQQQAPQQQDDATTNQGMWKLSQLYCTVSSILALLAILTAPSHDSLSSTLSSSSSMMGGGGGGLSSPSTTTTTTTTRVGGVFFDNSGGGGQNVPLGSSSSSSFASQWSVEQVAKAAAIGAAAKREKKNRQQEQHLEQHNTEKQQEQHDSDSSNNNDDDSNKVSTYSSHNNNDKGETKFSTSPFVVVTPHDLFLSLHEFLADYLLLESSTQDDEQQQQQQQQTQTQDEGHCNVNPVGEDGEDTRQPGWLRWVSLGWTSSSSSSTTTCSNSNNNKESSSSFARTWSSLSWTSFIDPTLLHPSASTPTDIIDKILTSTPRLLAVANFLLAMTYALHTAVAIWFLGNNSVNSHHRTTRSSLTGGGGQGAGGPMMGGMPATMGNAPPPPPPVVVVDWASSSGARERMGGFLVFKLLLISAVVAPDTLDLLILLTWYTLLSCLRSLDHLCHTTTSHTAASGQSPRRGVLRLLLLVLGTDFVAAASCVALFHAAGWGMVLLLTCDCAILAVDIACHMVQHATCVVEDIHTEQIASLEARQMQMHAATTATAARVGGGGGRPSSPTATTTVEEEATTASHNNDQDLLDEEEEEEAATAEQRQRQRQHEANERTNLQRQSRQLDRQMELLEVVHSRRLVILETSMFALQLLSHGLTVAHFLHIWSLHGVQFTLIDGVLALHLHSALSSACKKIAQRRNIHSIARDLNGLFPNASEHELRKATLSGDVCCICLGTMSTGHVKKVKCGHLYHTHCLREVVERAQSVQAAKCPLCRASVVDGRQQPPPPTTVGGNVNATGGTAATATTNVGNSLTAGQENLNNDINNVDGGGPVTPRTLGAGAAAGPLPVGADPAEPVAPPRQQQQQQQQPPPGGGNANALFRFSTEGIVPAWIPLPAFSFEVVRRPPLGGPVVQQPPPQLVARAAPAGDVDPPAPEQRQGLQPQQDEQPAGAQVQQPPGQPQQRQQEPSFLRRFLVLAGAIPMSAEEEARALGQLVDMFPQYDRSDLLRELRERGSAEAVVEAVLMGVFSGVARG